MSIDVAPPQPIRTDVVAPLSATDLPTNTLQLPCARCYRTQAAHTGRPPDCDAFVRPRLPSGHAYVEDLRPEDRFRFLSALGLATVRVALDRTHELDESMGLLQLRSSTALSTEDVHLVQRHTVVLVPPAWVPTADGPHPTP